jgi:heavy metal translocating P-type ATPase
MRPETALLVQPTAEKHSNNPLDFSSSSPTSIPANQIELGDYILIQPGDVPPADGVIVSGATTFDESSLTGEFMPVSKTVEDTIMTGTTNLTAAIVIRVTNVGDETMLQKIVNAVAEGQSRKAPIERVADHITAVFIPFVVYLALLVLIIWLALSLGHAIPDSYLPEGRTDAGDRVFFAFEFAISCLVIACPCGIGLAAPTAQAVGSGMAARAGILAQGGGKAFQAAAGVDVVVFDKTGTLTKGEAVVVDAKLATVDSTEHKGVHNWVWNAVRMMESASSHPLALAITKYCVEMHGDDAGGVRILDNQEVAGRGLRASVALNGSLKSVFVGNETFIAKDNAAVFPSELPLDHLQAWRESGHSVVLVAVADHQVDQDSKCVVRGFLAIADTLRPEAPATVAKLQASGLEVFMLTGDNETTARAVAKQLGIDVEHVKAGVLPHEKADFISQLQDRRLLKHNWY